MNIAQIEQNLQTLIKSFSKDTFIYDLLRTYGLPNASISRLQKGNLNMSKVDGEISWKKKLFFKEVLKGDLHIAITDIKKTINHAQRFIIVTDYKILLAFDTKTDDSLDIELKDLAKHYDFFLPWAGMEKAQHQNENTADVKAAEKMAKLFDEIRKDNPGNEPEFVHNLNVFLSRLLFCFFAEDTNIFAENQFTNAIDSHTQTDGSDLDIYLNRLFEILDTPENKRVLLSGAEVPKYLADFPYVNGSLFKGELQSGIGSLSGVEVPKFTRRSRQAIIDSGELDWSAINPDIFGSMFQAVIDTDQRGSLGQHYTSVPNIMKVIEPLFLNELYGEFEKAKGKAKKLNELVARIGKLKIFDPACGSGNFLIIAYKELRQLEMKIFKEIDFANRTHSNQFSVISLSNFYGIEIDDFAHEIAKLALWLAEHQMNMEFFKAFGRTNPTLPLKEAGQITKGNATRLDWEKVCPKNEGDEIYILGNPPYLGGSLQNVEQKSDLEFVFEGYKNFKNLDYISCWFLKGSEFINGINSRLSFVTTNSISQGEQVSMLWKHIFNFGVEINFAYQSFKWTNNAKGNAGVIVVIIGLQNEDTTNKYLYLKSNIRKVNNISPYLLEGNNSFVEKRKKLLSSIQNMNYGSKPTDGGNLLLTDEEKQSLVSTNSNAEKFIKKLTGAREIINGIERWCIWIEDKDLKQALEIPEIDSRVKKVQEMRKLSPKKATQKLADEPHKFGEIRYYKSSSIVIPRHSSENRTYIPFGFIDETYVISDSAQAIYNAEPWTFSILSSCMHMTWMRTVAGRLKTDYRYSSTLVYNTFPFPKITKVQKEEITQTTFKILEEREKYSEKTLAQLYDPDKMPEGLREAHRQNDLAIERCYRKKPFESDEERLEYLFKLYEKMIAEEKEK